MAHARTALAFGDPTAKLMGRITWNPFAHLDPMGTLAIVFAGFGWAKPVPVNMANLHPRRMGSIAVSLAGPLSNLAFAFLIGILMDLLWRFDLYSYIPFSEQLYDMLFLTLVVNLMLFDFNLIPLYPLDGHHILREMLSPEKQSVFMKLQTKYGPFILISLIGLQYVNGIDPLTWFFHHAIGPLMRLIFPQ
jgi:Zn-dependent protease